MNETPIVGTQALIEALEREFHAQPEAGHSYRSRAEDCGKCQRIVAILARVAPAPVMDREAVEAVLLQHFGQFIPLGWRHDPWTPATDAILALGTDTPSPQTVTTVAELEALPVAAVIRDSGGQVFQKGDPQDPSDTDWHGTHSGTLTQWETPLALPATVLSEATPLALVWDEAYKAGLNNASLAEDDDGWHENPFPATVLAPTPVVTAAQVEAAALAAHNARHPEAACTWRDNPGHLAFYRDEVLATLTALGIPMAGEHVHDATCVLDCPVKQAARDGNTVGPAAGLPVEGER